MSLFNLAANKPLSIVYLCFVVLLSACHPSTEKATESETHSTAMPNPFVRVSGQQFLWKDQPYRYVGTNYWYGAYIGATDPQRMQGELDFLIEHGVTNLRVLAVSEQSELTRAVRPGMLAKNGELDSQLMQGLDLFLAEAGKRNIKVVLYLTNFWQWSGGMTQYNQWYAAADMLDPDTTGRWDDYMEASADFYTCEPCQNTFRKTIETLIQRKNTVTGRRYKDDPTIMSWQLANEPRPGGNTFSQERADAYDHWVSTTASFIKQLAPHQLVSTGSEGIKGSQESAEVYMKAHAHAAIDYMTVHLWIKNWGWFDIHNAEATFEGAKHQALSYLRQHADMATTLNKPLVLEEFGAERDRGLLAPGTATQYRDEYYRTVFHLIEQYADGPYAGSNFWAFAGSGRAGDNPEVWAEGDDFLGDPPQEAQGLNGVFDADHSTWKVIKAHAEKLAGQYTLGQKKGSHEP